MMTFTKDELIKKAQNYISHISKKVNLEGQEKLINMINSTNDIEQMQDCLISLYLASVFSNITVRLVLEEPWMNNSGNISYHDLVAYLPNGTRIANEIKRLKQTNWDKKEKNLIINSVTKTGKLYELKENPNRSTTGYLDTILNEISIKENQFETDVTNILWIASKGLHYQATDIEDAASHFARGYSIISCNKPETETGRAHIKPANLTAIGWLWDGDLINSTAKPHCFIISHSYDLKSITNIINVKILNKNIITKKNYHGGK